MTTIVIIHNFVLTRIITIRFVDDYKIYTVSANTNFRYAARPEVSSVVSRDNARPGHRVDILFGMPRYNCRYHGICKLDVDESDFRQPAPLSCGRGKGWLLLPHPAYALLCVDKRQLTVATREFHFSGSYFELPEAVPFGPDLAARFRVDHYLQAGRYRIMDKDTVFSVLFELVCPATHVVGDTRTQRLYQK